jgi:hypothetical protein
MKGRRPTDKLGGRAVLPFQQSKRMPLPSTFPSMKKGRKK